MLLAALTACTLPDAPPDTGGTEPSDTLEGMHAFPVDESSMVATCTAQDGSIHALLSLTSSRLGSGCSPQGANLTFAGAADLSHDERCTAFRSMIDQFGCGTWTDVLQEEEFSSSMSHWLLSDLGGSERLDGMTGTEALLWQCQEDAVDAGWQGTLRTLRGAIAVVEAGASAEIALVLPGLEGHVRVEACDGLRGL